MLSTQEQIKDSLESPICLYTHLWIVVGTWRKPMQTDKKNLVRPRIEPRTSVLKKQIHSSNQDVWKGSWTRSQSSQSSSLISVPTLIYCQEGRVKKRIVETSGQNGYFLQSSCGWGLPQSSRRQSEKGEVVQAAAVVVTIFLGSWSWHIQASGQDSGPDGDIISPHWPPDKWRRWMDIHFRGLEATNTRTVMVKHQGSNVSWFNSYRVVARHASALSSSVWSKSKTAEGNFSFFLSTLAAVTANFLETVETGRQ